MTLSEKELQQTLKELIDSYFEDEYDEFAEWVEIISDVDYSIIESAISGFIKELKENRKARSE